MEEKDNQSKNVTTTETMNIGSIELSRKNIVSQELVDILYTKEEVALLNEGVSVYEITMLNKLFGRKYIMSESGNIVNRLRQSNTLLKKIETHDQQAGGNPYRTIITTGGFLDEPYNKQRKYHGEELYPNNKKIDNELLVDLFSQGYVDLLEFKEIDEDIITSRKAELIKERGNAYLFNPKNMIYVDISNRDKELTHERGINQLYVKDDSLRFIALLPDNSTNYVISGFDDYIIKSHTDLGGEYLDHLVNEIKRTTKKGGIVAGINFERRSLLGEKGLKNITPPKYDPFSKEEKKRDPSGFYSYEKE